MNIQVYNKQGKPVNEMEISDEIFGVKVKPEVVHEIFVAQTNNKREPWADTKNRGEVSGGGKKPWQQKGTGRARHGSIRSPIWKGGGVTFGPLSIRNYKTKINKKTRRVAIRMCLTDKVASGAFWVLEDLKLDMPKTKLFSAILKSLPVKTKNFLVLTAGKDSDVIRATANLSKVNTLRAEDANVADLINCQAVVISVDGVKKLEETFNK